MDVWRDKWISSKDKELIDKFRGPLPTPFKLRELIQEEQRRWKEELLIPWFDQDDVRAIMAISLKGSEVNDTLIWAANSKGCFSCKLANYHAREVLGKEVNPTSACDIVGSRQNKVLGFAFQNMG